MKKQILILLFCCLILGLIGCSKGQNEASNKNDTATNEETESIQEENNRVHEENNNIQEEESIDVQEESINIQEEQDDTEVPTISSRYFPVNGNYNNGSSDEFHYIIVTGIDQSSFSFTIHDGMTKNLVFKEHIAVFEEQDSTTAVYRGENYTLVFDCSEYATITLTGFEELISAPGNTFWNSNVLHTS